MPTLKLIATLTKEGEKHCRSGIVRKESLPVDEEESSSDDRFSQASSRDLDLTRTVGGKASKDGRATKKSREDSAERIVPFSIASAISNHRSLCRSRGTKHEIRPNKKCNDKRGNGSNATDIVAVVLSTAIHQAPMPSYSKTPKRSNFGSRVNLLIGDPSLPSGQCARVTMKVSPSNISASLASLLGIDGMGGINSINSSISSPAKKSSKNAVRLGQLQPGDVVRWNRLEVRNDYEEDKTSSSPGLAKKQKLSRNDSNGSNSLSSNKCHHPLLSVSCDLSLSWRDPAAGPSLARLCRIIPTTSSANAYGYDLEWENIIPPNMGTSKELVMGLAGWYCDNARPHFSKSTAIFPTNVPCQRRLIRDINAPNVLSHVVVKVLRCEKALSAFSTPNKTKSNYNGHDALTHVTISDGAESDDLIGMRGSQGRISGSSSFLPKSISSILQKSMKDGSRVLLTHTLSQSVNPESIGGDASLQGRESLVLIPTRETTATILTPDHPYYVREQSTRREEENQFVSQLLTLERASQLFSMTQEHSPAVMEELPSDRRCRGEMAVIAPLMDIIVDGVDASFIEGSHWKAPHKLSKFLIDCPSISTGMKAIKLNPSYRSATLILDPNSVSSEIVVNADGNAMKLLCMDVPVDDMVIDDPSVSTSNPYLGHVCGLLKALCAERTPIRWVLEQESECNWFVTNATLLQI